MSEKERNELAQRLIAIDPECFEPEQEEAMPRMFESSHLWNDGNNYPPGFNELTEL